MRYALFALLVMATGWARAQDIIGYEYWFDQDGADGERTYVSVTPDGHIALGNESLAISGLGIGHHTIRYRLRDSNGRWSSVLSKPFTRVVGGPYQMISGEYWFNTDDQDRTPFALGPDQTVDEVITADVSGMGRGHHKARYRIRDDHGFWSSVLTKPFSVLPGGPYELVLLRYWSDSVSTVPSDMTEVPITPNVQYLDIINDVLFCNWSQTGQTDVYFQLKDNHGQWSSVITDNSTISGSTQPPLDAGMISGPIAPMFGSTYTYSTAPVSGAAGYAWTLPNGWTGNPSGTSITVQVGGGNDGSQLCVRAYNGCGEGEPSCLAISTGLGQNMDPGGIVLFPNPAADQVKVQVDAGVIGQVVVFDALGQEVLRANAMSNTLNLDVLSLATGTYILRLSSDQRVRTVRFNIQR